MKYIKINQKIEILLFFRNIYKKNIYILFLLIDKNFLIENCK